MESQSPPLDLPAPEAAPAAVGSWRVALKVLAVAWVWLVFAGALIALTGREESSAPDIPEPVAIAIPRLAAAAPMPPPPSIARGERPLVEILPPATHSPGEAGLFGGGGAIIPQPAAAENDTPAPEPARPTFISGLVPQPATPAPAPVSPATPPREEPRPAAVTPPPPEPRVALAPAPEPPRLVPARIEPRAEARPPPTPPPAAPRQVAAVPPGPAPHIRQGGAWQQYRRPFNPADPRPRIAIVIGELGVGAAATETAMSLLPGGVTLLFNSATPLPVLQDLIVRARATGHEVLITLPLNPEAVPTASLSEAQDVAGYAGGLLERLGGAAGVVPSQMVGLAGAAALRATLGHAQRRGMMVVSRGGGPVLDTARQLQLPRLVVDATLDDQVGRGNIDARLAAIERRARETGIALAFGRPYAVTIQRLSAWIQSLESRGFALAPTTALVQRYRDR